MTLKRHGEIEENRDYFLVSQKVWRYLQGIFGGGPQIMLSVVPESAIIMTNMMQTGGYNGGNPDRFPKKIRVECSDISSSFPI